MPPSRYRLSIKHLSIFFGECFFILGKQWVNKNRQKFYYNAIFRF